MCDYAPSYDEWLEDLQRERTDEEIAAEHEERIRARWREIPAGREALLTWLHESRVDTPWPDGPLTLEEQAEDLNRCESSVGGGTLWIAFDGHVVSEGGAMHRDLLAQAARQGAPGWR